jgi:DNA repair protein RadC
MQGHRQRLRERFLKAKPGTLQDYEILELLLCTIIPRRDVKPLAKDLLKQCGSLGGVINLPPSKLLYISGVGESVVAFFKLLKETANALSKEQIMDKPILSSTSKILEYIRISIGYKTTEHLLALYLNARKHLIAEETHDYGTVNGVGVYPRELLKAAIYHDASYVILAHNHPSGATKPSQADITLTSVIQKTLQAAEIVLADHIIISPSSSFSFCAHNMI